MFATIFFIFYSFLNLIFNSSNYRIWFYFDHISFTGLFKLEWSGEGFLGLNAKSYYCFKHGEGEEKYSSKGVSKRNRLTKDNYMAVLKMNTPYKTDHFETSSISSTQENRGFIFKDSQMVTYSMIKEGLKNFYCKRIVLSNGLSTKPLEI